MIKWVQNNELLLIQKINKKTSRYKEDNAYEAADNMICELKRLLTICGFSGGFNKLSENDYPGLVKGINLDSIIYSPAKILTDNEIISLLGKIREGI